MAMPWAKKFYDSRAWKNIRKEALRRDLYTCCRCQNRAEEVHHIIALTEENIHDPHITLNLENLESLCHTCHTKETKGNDGDIVDGFIFSEDGQVVLKPPR